MVSRPKPIQSAPRPTDAVFRFVHRRLEVDTRALAALRIALGGILLVDLTHRARRVGLVFGPAGVYPRSVHEATYGEYGTLSIHALSDAIAFQAALFVLAGLFAVAFAVGYRTRLVGTISLLLLVSLHVRYPVVLNGGDRLLRVLLLVALLTPLGERFSIDASLRESSRTAVASVGTAALLFQPVVVFTSNAVEKSRGHYWIAGDGLELALADPTMTTAFGSRLLDVPVLLSALNYGWIGLLAGAIPLLLITTGRVRTVASLLYLCSFAAMGISLSVGLFPLVLAASVVPFLTTPFWNRIGMVAADRPTIRRTVMRVRTLLDSHLRYRFRLAHARRAAPTRRLDVIARALPTVVATVVLVWMLTFAAVGFGGPDSQPSGPLEHLDQQDWGLYAPDPSETYHWTSSPNGVSDRRPSPSTASWCRVIARRIRKPPTGASAIGVS